LLEQQTKEELGNKLTELENEKEQLSDKFNKKIFGVISGQLGKCDLQFNPKAQEVDPEKFSQEKWNEILWEMAKPGPGGVPERPLFRIGKLLMVGICDHLEKAITHSETRLIQKMTIHTGISV
jgi:hypothetical protein